MIYSIENEHLKISVNTKGGELYSVFSKKTNVEYLWQGDPKYWSGRAYNLFPFIGTMYENIFNHGGKTYPSRPHGLARYFEFVNEEYSQNRIVMLLTENEETLKEYPFRFEYRVFFTLNGNVLTVRQEVKNIDDKTLYCAFGGHPGINIPFDGGKFEDYYLEFSEKTDVRRQLLSESDTFMADKAIPYPLVDGVKLPLQHNLFDHDAIILENTSGYVAFKSKVTNRSVGMHYEDFPFIGFWHTERADAPFVCLEPWGALPAIDGKVVDLETKPHMTKVLVGEKAEATFTLEINE